MTALSRRREKPWRNDDIEAAIPPGFTLASGELLPDGHICCSHVGAANGPQILAMGGISAGRDVCSETGWWRATLIDADALDLDRVGVVGLDFAPLGDDRVRITPKDQARLVSIALDALGVAKVRAFVGASYGGMVGLAFAALAPERLERLCVFSASHRPSALGAAWRGVQRRIVEFGLAHNDGDGGLALARQLAMTTYRSPAEFGARFGVGLDAGGRSAADFYLEARGTAYPEIMRPRRWLSLSEAIDRHQVDPTKVLTPTTLVACESDQLVPLADIAGLSEKLPRLNAFHTINSIYGHDAFLKETAQIAAIVAAVLEDD
ncbi:MAG: homoserine O-succinyltransferase MetX [Caulobacteraceae bacterium]